MSNFCEKCGKPVQNGEVFCVNCARSITSISTSKIEEVLEDHEVFTFKGRRSSFWIKLFNFFPFLLGFAAILLGGVSFLPDTLGVSLPDVVLPLVTLALGIIFILLISRQLKKSNLLLMSLGVIFIALAGTLVLSDYSMIILSVGISISALILVISVVRHVKRFPLWGLGFVTIIAALGGAIVFPTFQILILSISCIFLGVILILTRL